MPICKSETNFRSLIKFIKITVRLKWPYRVSRYSTQYPSFVTSARAVRFFPSSGALRGLSWSRNLWLETGFVINGTLFREESGSGDFLHPEVHGYKMKSRCGFLYLFPFWSWHSIQTVSFNYSDCAALLKTLKPFFISKWFRVYLFEQSAVLR